MLFEFNFYSCSLLILFVHILVYGMLFIKRSYLNDSYSDKLMSIFLILAAMLITPFMVGFAGWYDNQPYRDVLFFVPLVHTLFLGPILYFYTRSIFDSNFRIKKTQFLHFLPGILYLIYATANSLINITITHDYLKTLEREDPDFDQWYTLFSLASILIYLLLTIRYYRSYNRFTALTTSFAEQASAKWLRNFLYAFAMLCTISIVKTILANFEFFEKMRYFGPWYYYLGFGIVSYYIAISAYHARLLSFDKIHFEPELLSELEEQVAIPVEAPNINTANDQKVKEIAAQLQSLMESEQLFKQADLTLLEVAKKLGTNPVLLSRTVNQYFELNFNDYVNRYRTQAVVELIQKQDTKHLTLLAIALEAGFNSKATFNRAFKKFTGKNPKDCLKEERNN